MQDPTNMLINIKPINVKPNTYVGFPINYNIKKHKFNVDDHVQISKYKSIFSEGCTPNRTKEVLAVKKSQRYISMDLCD